MLLLRQIKKGLCESPNQDIRTEAMNHLLDRRIQVQSLLLSLVVTSDSKNWSLTAWLMSKPKTPKRIPVWPRNPDVSATSRQSKTLGCTNKQQVWLFTDLVEKVLVWAVRGNTYQLGNGLWTNTGALSIDLFFLVLPNFYHSSSHLLILPHQQLFLLPQWFHLEIATG